LAIIHPLETEIELNSKISDNVENSTDNSL
jgi:hypothetical protein